MRRNNKGSYNFLKEINSKYFSSRRKRLLKFLYIVKRISFCALSIVFTTLLLCSFSIPLIFIDKEVINKTANICFDVAIGFFAVIVITSVISLAMKKDEIFNKNKFSIFFNTILVGAYSIGTLFIHCCMFVISGFISLVVNNSQAIMVFSVETMVTTFAFLICLLIYLMSSNEHKYKKYIQSIYISFKKPKYQRYVKNITKIKTKYKNENEVANEFLELNSPQTLYLVCMINRFDLSTDDPDAFSNCLNFINIHMNVYSEYSSIDSLSDILDYSKLLILLNQKVVPYITKKKDFLAFYTFIELMTWKIKNSHFIKFVLSDVEFNEIREIILDVKHFNEFSDYSILVDYLKIFLEKTKDIYEEIEKKSPSSYKKNISDSIDVLNKTLIKISERNLYISNTLSSIKKSITAELNKLKELIKVEKNKFDTNSQ